MFGLSVYKDDERVGQGYTFCLIHNGIMVPPTLWDDNDIELENGEYQLVYTGAQTLVVMPKTIQ